MEQGRFAQEEQRRRRVRSEEAARTLLELCYRAGETTWAVEQHRRDSRDHEPGRAREELDILGERQDEALRMIRIRLQDLDSKEVRVAVGWFVSCLERVGIVEQMGGGPRYQVVNVAVATVADVLGSYVREEPLPDVSALKEFIELIDEDDAYQAEIQRRWEEEQRSQKEEAEGRGTQAGS